MSTAEHLDPRRWRIAVAGVLLLALILRLWGIRQGLPFAYNADENAHFVPKAIGMFGHSKNPDYFLNPPAYTYLLHVLFAVWFGGREGVGHAFALDASEVFTVARVAVALLGTLAVWLLYLATARLLGDRRVALLAATLLAVAFLPVHYAHYALNDVPTLAGVTLALLGAAGIARRGRTLDFVLAGIGLGLGAATKYTGGIVLLPIAAAVVIRWQAAPADRRRLALLSGGTLLLALGGVRRCEPLQRARLRPVPRRPARAVVGLR